MTLSRLSEDLSHTTFARTTLISGFVLETVTVQEVPEYKWRVTVIRLTPHDCPLEVRQPRTDHAEIRSLVRLYKKSSPSPPREIPNLPAKKVQFLRQDPPPPEPLTSTSKLRRFSHAEMRRPSIRFATSTALYTPAKPTYGTSFELGTSSHLNSHLI